MPTAKSGGDATVGQSLNASNARPMARVQYRSRRAPQVSSEESCLTEFLFAIALACVAACDTRGW
jgi:hypothetical protein